MDNTDLDERVYGLVKAIPGITFQDLRIALLEGYEYFDEWRKIDRALQRLRKNLKIHYSRRNGWRIVP